MAGRVYLSMAYVAPRAIMWILMLVVALVDGIRHRTVRSRGYQLYWALVGSAALFVLQEIVLVLLVALSEYQSVNKPTLAAYIFFADLAASYWFGILLLVAAGFCITRTSLGPHKNVVISIPIIYFVTALVVDYVLYWIRGFDAFTDQSEYYEQIPEEAAEKVGGTTGLVYLICLLANTMAMLLAWFFIFDTIQKEKEILEQGYPDVSALPPHYPQAAQPGLPRTGAPTVAVGLPTSSAAAAPGGGEGGVGHSVMGANAVLLDESGGNMSHMYIDVVEADLDQPKTVHDKVDEREKLRLIRRFFFGVCFYLVLVVLVIFLPLFVPSVVDRTILVLQNVVLWVFLAVLLWTFRMRQGSLYLMVDEGAEHETGLVEATTELGMLSHHEDGTAGTARFTLSDEEEHHTTGKAGGIGGGSGSGAAGGAARSQPRLNIDAASEHGVMVMPLPTPQTPAALPPPPELPAAVKRR